MAPRIPDPRDLIKTNFGGLPTAERSARSRVIRKSAMMWLVHYALFLAVLYSDGLFDHGSLGPVRVIVSAVWGVIMVIAFWCFVAYKKHKNSKAEAPRNLRVKWMDGSEQPVECVFVGRKKGINHWNLTQPLQAPPGVPPFPELLADYMPDKTAIGLAIAT